MMDANKRSFLAAIVPMVLGVRLGVFSSTVAAHTQNGLPAKPQPAQSPGPPKLEQTMPSDEIKPNSKEAKDILKQNQKQIAENVEKIYQLAGELKGEVEKTDASNTLSLGMIQKAEQIEKLAKQVKNLARG
jgi:peptidoglycan hydrolase CwlO-like protein